jgi:N-methylhydantoinase A/oxoprolinase/acetone carboxylase beta subunit
LPGPNVIEGTVETVVVPPGWQARVDEIGSILISRSTE